MRETNFVRLCTEVNVNCKYEHDVTVVLDDKRSFGNRVKYRWELPRSSHCKVFGHSGRFFQSGKV